MKEIRRLLRIMKALRHPQKGCPWDLKQDKSSLKEYIIEEAYELVEAIEKGNSEEQKKELGDLLLQIVFLSQIQSEQGGFSFRDVASVINEKLVRRHPHIFAKVAVASAEEVRHNWERIKMEEKKKESVLSDYPEKMPALLTAGRIASQASSVGFDWNDAGQALQKVKEEIQELEEEIRSRRSVGMEREIGDLLFAVANVARLLTVNSEFALAATNRKFTRRFRFIEARLRDAGKTFKETSLAEMEALWLEAKKIEIVKD